MKHAISLLAFLCSCTIALGEDYDTQPLFAQLSAAIDSIPEYDAAHRKAIDGLKQRLSLASGNAAEEMRINNLIIDAYYKLSYDSTRAYLDRNLQLARELGDAGQTTEMLLRKARLYAKAGSYLEAVSMVQKLSEDSLNPNLRQLYYDACRDVYGEAGHYSTDADINEVTNIILAGKGS